MKFTESFRMEKAYFQKLKSDIDIAKSYIAAGAIDEARSVLESIVDVDGAVLLLYRNLGEIWSDLMAKLEELAKALKDLDEKTEKYHDELNQKIDDVNNYLMALIRDILTRLEDLEYIVDNIGFGNLQNFIPLVQTSDLPGNFKTDTTVPYPYFYESVRMDEDYIGGYIVNRIIRPNDLGIVWSEFASFDPNFDIEIISYRTITNYDDIIHPEGSPRYGYQQSSESVRAKCINGTVQDLIHVTDSYQRQNYATIGDTRNFIFGDDLDQEIYGHVLITFYIYSATKTVAEWVTFLNSQVTGFYNSIFQGVYFLDGIPKKEDTNGRRTKLMSIGDLMNSRKGSPAEL